MWRRLGDAQQILYLVLTNEVYGYRNIFSYLTMPVPLSLYSKKYIL